MHRNYLLSLLDQFQTDDLECKNRMINFIKDNPNCFERSLAIGHMTASSWLLNHDGTKALLMHHRKLDDWLQLGGHCDGDPNILAVAIREAQEESGIDEIIALQPNIFDIDIHLIPARPYEGEHYHYDVRFLLQLQTLKEVIMNGESKGMVWVDVDGHNLPTKGPSIMRMFTKWQNLAMIY